MTCCNTPTFTVKSESGYYSGGTGLGELEFVNPEYFQGISEQSYQDVLKTFGEVVERNPIAEYGHEEVIELRDYFESELGDTIVNETVRDSDGFLKPSYPVLKDLVGSGIGITPNDFANFMEDYSYTSVDNVYIDIDRNPNRFLNGLELWFAGTGIGNGLSTLCSIAGAIGAAQDILKNPSQFITGQFSAFMEGIKSMVERVVEGIRTRVENMAKGLQNTLDTSKDELQGPLIRNLKDKFESEYVDAQTTFSKFNIMALIGQIERIVGEAIAVFRERSQEVNVIQYLIRLLCGLTSAVEQSLSKPVERIGRLSTKTSETVSSLKRFSEDTTRDSVQAGRAYATPASLRQACREFATLHNASLNGSGNGLARGGETASRLVKDLQRDFGLTREQASGIVGNLAYESGDFQTMQEISPLAGEGGYGIAQWTGSRRDQFEAYARQNGLSPDSYEANYGFLKYELSNTSEGSVIDRIRRTNSVEESARIFSNDYLRPGIVNMRDREGKARSVYNNSIEVPASAPIDPNKRQVFNPSLTTHPEMGSWSNLGFNPSVSDNGFWSSDRTIRMVDYGGGSVYIPDLGLPNNIGYLGCRLDIIEMLNEVGSQMGITLWVNSAFRHKVYNQYLRQSSSGVAKNSQHISGKALDVSMNGVNRDEFVSRARQIGFRGIGYYNTFIHVDVGPKRSWG